MILLAFPDETRSACADGMVESARTYLNSTFFTSLNQLRSSCKKAEIVDQLFSDAKHIVEGDPTKWTSQWEYYLMEVQKNCAKVTKASDIRNNIMHN